MARKWRNRWAKPHFTCYNSTKRIQISSKAYTLAKRTPYLCTQAPIAPLLALDKPVFSRMPTVTALQMVTLDVEAWPMTLQLPTTTAKDLATTAVVFTLPNGPQLSFVFGSFLVTVFLRVWLRALLTLLSLDYPWPISKVPATLTHISPTTVSSSILISVVHGLDSHTRTSRSVH